MDSTNLCNALRMEFEGIFENKIPLDAFPAKIQDMILALSRQENYSIEYMMASLLVAVSTAIGNAVNIRMLKEKLQKRIICNRTCLHHNFNKRIKYRNR